MEWKTYKSVIKQLQFIMNSGTCMKKEIQEMIKESKVMNNTNTHAYLQAEVNVMFMQMHTKKGINFFGEMLIAKMIK